MPSWATLNEIHVEYNIPISTLRDWIKKGRLPAYKLGPRQIRIDRNDVEKQRRRIPAAPGPRKAQSA